jgi:two-component system, chemotaxis family, chemotaxis protein CheY
MTPKKVLVVDDSELVHKMHAAALRKYPGCQVLHAYHGGEAFDALNLNPDVDLILLDVNMPTMDGLTFLKTRGEAGVFLEIPVIMISTESSEEDKRRGLEAGANEYLTKPILPSQLRAAIDALSP